MKYRAAELREPMSCLKHLAFWTITEQGTDRSELFHLTGSESEDIHVVMTLDEIDVEKQQRALDCYVTYRETIEARQDGSAGSGVLSRARRCLRSIRRHTIRHLEAWLLT